MWWLLESNVREAIELAIKTGVNPTAEQQALYQARVSALSSDAGSRVLTLAGNTAEVAIEGVITKSPNWLAMIFGGGNTVYSEITAALAQADANPEIDNIVLAIDSPGGHFDGLFDTIAAIQQTQKPTKAVISGLGASAAYALASQADTIEATNVAARIGSVGVAATFDVDENEITITSTNAPNKRPDVTTEEGVAMVREELDAMHQIFVEAIAEGRGSTVERVNAEFGRGGTLLANEALKRGMIDSVASPTTSSTETQTTAQSGGDQPEKGPMDLNTLRTQHPDVYQAAVDAGRTEERDRVCAHLTMGEASGDMATAITAVNDGSGMTASLQAKYMAAGMNRQNVNDRQDDDDDANAGDNATASGDNGDNAEDVASKVEAALGISAE